MSPGGVGDINHDWKVLPYQLIGQVKISRMNNPGLYDMANREGLIQNDEYLILCEIILQAIDYFEIDRRGFYREYTKWKKDIVKSFGTDANIRADVIKKKEDKKTDSPIANEGKRIPKYTEEEYQDTVYKLMQEKDSMLNAQQILQMLSSAGLILNTFFHEFKAMESQFGARAPQLRRRLDYMIQNENLHPGMIYDPYIIIDKMQETDAVLALWMELALNKIEKPNLKIKKADLLVELKQALERWDSLLKSKDITIKNKSDETLECEYEFSKVDLYIILNNFLLNSVYFLEKGKNENRLIEVSLTSTKEFYNLQLWNNGPTLDAMYQSVPDKVFELGDQL